MTGILQSTFSLISFKITECFFRLEANLKDLYNKAITEFCMEVVSPAIMEQHKTVRMKDLHKQLQPTPKKITTWIWLLMRE